MSSRDTILSRIGNIKLETTKKLPELEFSGSTHVFNDFKMSLEKVGGKLVMKKDIQDVSTWIKKVYGSDNRVYSEVELIKGNFQLGETTISNEELNKIHVAVLPASIGIAENGAVWMHSFRHRAIPFIAQHLVVSLHEEAIVGNMHQAYEKIAKTSLPPFGVFVSGPSKTADIEQSLVYGAHGPKSLTIIVEES